MLILLAAAHAITPEALTARLAEVAPLRSQRLSADAPVVPESAYEKVARGKFATGLVDADGTKARKVWGVGIVDTPIATYFSAINDDRNKPEYTKLDNVIVLKGEPCGSDRVVFQSLPVPLLNDRWWVVQQRINTALQDSSDGRVREMTWRPAESGIQHMTPLALAASAGNLRVTFTYGGWFLIDLGDGQTLVEFWSWSDPGGNVPVRMASSFAAGGIEDTFGTMSDLATKGPSCQL